MNIAPNHSNVRRFNPFPRGPLARLAPPLKPINQSAGWMLRAATPPGRFLRPRQFLMRPPLEKILGAGTACWFWAYAIAHAVILAVFILYIARP